MNNINSTKKYHKEERVDLSGEFTICESLAAADSPYMIALQKPKPYGVLLGDFLLSCGALKQNSVVMEIGGGYGSLMRGFLSVYADMIQKVIMCDLSFDLLKKQREVLSGWPGKAVFVQADAHNLNLTDDVDLIIINEVIGDLDTATDVDPENIPHEIKDIIDRYKLPIPDQRFNFNMGAVKLVESLCKSKASVFICEHSCDPIIPRDMPYLQKDLDADGFPREIRLNRHSEYTIKFSHLINVAKSFGKKIDTGSLLDLVKIRTTYDMKFIFENRICSNERQEIIYELLDHIREYRWLVIKNLS